MLLARTTPAGLPRPLPLLGHALQLLWNPWEFPGAVRPLGDIVKIRIGPRPAYIVNSPDLIRRVLVVDAMRELTAEKAASWRDGEQIALDQELMQLTLRIVGKTLFNTELRSAAVDEVVRSMPTVLSGITKRTFAPTKLLEKLPTAENRRFNQANRWLREVVDRIIAEYRRSEVDNGDVVSMLLLARDEETGEGMSDAQVRDEVVTMLLAGTETIADTLSWALHVLGQRPDVEARLHAEVDEVLGAGEVTFEHIGRLPYVRRVISETLRLYPPAWLLTRRTSEPVTLG